MATPVAALIVRVAADIAELKAGVGEINSTLGKVEGAAGQLKSALASAFTIGAITGYVTEMVNFADRMQDMSERTGIGVEELQALNFAAVGAGTTVETLTQAITRLSSRLAGDDKSAVKAMADLGLNTQAFLALSPEQRLFAISDAAMQMGDANERNRILMELFGRQFQELIPVLTTGLREAADQARMFGGVIDESVIAKAAAAKDAWEQAKIIFMAGMFQMAEAAQMGFGATGAALAQSAKDSENLGKSIDQFVTQEMKRLTVATTDTHHQVATLSAEEARLTEELNRSVEASIRSKKALEEKAQVVAKTEAAYRQLTNWIGEQYIAAIAKQIAETERLREELNRIETTITENYLFELQRRNEATQAALDAQEAAWRRYQNEIGLILMEQDRLAMEHAEAQKITFTDMFESILEVASRIFGVDMRRVVQTFVDIWKAGRSGLSGVLKLMMTDFTSFFSGVMAAINLAIAAFNFFRNLFGGGEEGTVVNPARDRFLSQWGDPSNKGVGGAGWNLAALLTQFGAGEGGGPMFAALQRANTMALFRPAAQAIVDFLRSHGENAEMNFHSGGLVPGTGEVQATLLGGERVQSREEVAMFPDLLREQRGLREDINRFMEGMQRRVRDDVLLARGRA